MAAQFHQPYFTAGVQAGDGEVTLFEERLVGRVEAEVAGEALFDRRQAVDVPGARVRQQRNCLRSVDQRTGQAVDEQGGGGRRRLLVVGVDQAQDIAGILYQSMLKAPSGTDEGLAAFARKADARQRAFHAGVGAAGRGPERVEGLQKRLGLPTL